MNNQRSEVAEVIALWLSMAFLLTCVCVRVLNHSVTMSRAESLAQYVPVPFTKSAGGGGISVLGHTACGAGPGSCSGFGNVNTTGATLLIFLTACETSVCTVSDSKSNTWTALTPYSNATGNIKIYYAFGPTVGTGHTFTCTGSFAACGVIYASGTLTTSSVFDTGTDKGSAGGTGTTQQCSSLTPSATGELVVSLLGADSSVVSLSVDSGLTFLSADASPTDGSSEAFGPGYLVDGSASAIAPTWTLGASVGTAIAACAAFKHP